MKNYSGRKQFLLNVCLHYFSNIFSMLQTGQGERSIMMISHAAKEKVSLFEFIVQINAIILGYKFNKQSAYSHP
jgi:hypothetical protein